MRQGKYKVVGGKFVHINDLNKVSWFQLVGWGLAIFAALAVGVWL